MDLYHIWCDLKPGTSDTGFCESVQRYLGHLEDEGRIAGFRIARRKLALGTWVEPWLRLLALGRAVRGTPLDPFGHTRVRRAERELVRWYRDVLAALPRRLEASKLELAREIVEAPSRIRGFEEVKLSRIDAVRAEVSEKLATLARDDDPS